MTKNISHLCNTYKKYTKTIYTEALYMTYVSLYIYYPHFINDE